MIKKWNHRQNKHQAPWLCSRLDASGQSVYPKWSWMSVIKRNYAKTNGNLGLDTKLHLACSMQYKALGGRQCPEILLLRWESRQHLCCVNSVHDKGAGGNPRLRLLTTNRSGAFLDLLIQNRVSRFLFCATVMKEKYITLLVTVFILERTSDIKEIYNCLTFVNASV